MEQNTEYIKKLEAIAKAAQTLYYVAPPANTTVSPARIDSYIAALSDLHDALEEIDLSQDKQG